MQPSSNLKFQNEHEYQYFTLFKHEISDELSAGFTTALWNMQILQEFTSPSVRQLTLATSALKKAERVGNSNPDATFHRYYALQQYAKAIKGVREALEDQERCSMRTILFSAILIFCFENMMGDPIRAIKHMHSALELMQRQISREYSRKGFNRAWPPTLPSKADKKIKTVGERSGTDDKLDGQNISKGLSSDTPPPSCSPAPKYAPIPQKFISVNEARRWFEHVRSESLLKHSSSCNWGISFMPPDHAVPSMAELAKPVKYYLKLGEAPEYPREYFEQRALWHKAFAPLYADCLTPAGESKFVATMTMLIQALSVDCMVWGKVKDQLSKNAYRQMLASTRQLLNLAHHLVSHPKFTKSFVCDVGIIPSLWIVIMACPDLNLKREANAILKSMIPRIECVWSSQIVSEAGDKVLDIVENPNVYLRDDEEEEAAVNNNELSEGPKRLLAQLRLRGWDFPC